MVWQVSGGEREKMAIFLKKSNKIKLLAGFSAAAAVTAAVAFFAVPAPRADHAAKAPEFAPAEPPGALTFFHDGSEAVLVEGAEMLRFPHLLDPNARVNFRQTITLGRGDTLMNLLVAAGIPRNQAHLAIEALSKSLDPRKIRIGQAIEITKEKGLFQNDAPARLTALRLPLDFATELVVSAISDGDYSSKLSEVQTTGLRMYAAGVINDSLYLSALEEGVPPGVVSDLIRLFSFDVDFQREIWSGDKFAVYYERRLNAAGAAENSGKILAASLFLRGKPLTFYRYEGADGKAEYYTADGKSARKMLMKTPIDGARLTSRYGSRKHPVLGYTRMHKGVDFGANTGTPIMAAGDGIVEKASRWGSYGNYLSIRHNGTYKTAYAHLSAYARGIKAGTRVKQGQIVGYVGATGRVTGAHLHYEILVNGEQINPLTLKMPKGEDLKSAEISVFSGAVAGLEAQQASILSFYSQPTVRVAETSQAGGK